MHMSRSVHELGLACHVGWAGNARATPLCSESGGAAEYVLSAGTRCHRCHRQRQRRQLRVRPARAAVTRRRTNLWPTTHSGFPQAQSLVCFKMARSRLDV